jgi:hypothetical protein
LVAGLAGGEQEEKGGDWRRREETGGKGRRRMVVVLIRLYIERITSPNVNEMSPARTSQMTPR